MPPNPSEPEEVINSKPDILSHNIETVERVFSEVRPQGDYERSLEVLEFYSREGKAPVKSGIMLGQGYTPKKSLKSLGR